MSFFGGFNPFGGGGGSGRYPRPPYQNKNMRFGILPLMHPNQQMMPRMNQMGPRGGRPPFRGGKIYKHAQKFIYFNIL